MNEKDTTSALTDDDANRTYLEKKLSPVFLQGRDTREAATEQVKSRVDQLINPIQDALRTMAAQPGVTPEMVQHASQALSQQILEAGQNAAEQSEPITMYDDEGEVKTAQKMIAEMPLDSADRLFDWIKLFASVDYRSQLEQVQSDGYNFLPQSEYLYMDKDLEALKVVLERAKTQYGSDETKLRQIFRDMSPVRLRGYASDPNTNIQSIEEAHAADAVYLNRLNEARQNNMPLPISDGEIQQMAGTAILERRQHETDWQQDLESTNDPKTYNLMEARGQLALNIGERFAAHGLSKRNEQYQIESLLRILSNGFQGKPYEGVLKAPEEAAGGIGADGAYDTGGFILISRPSEKGRRVDIYNQNTNATEVGAVLVNRDFYPLIPRLQELYPTMKFIKASEMNDELTRWVQEVDSQQNQQ